MCVGLCVLVLVFLNTCLVRTSPPLLGIKSFFGGGEVWLKVVVRHVVVMFAKVTKTAVCVCLGFGVLNK